MLFFPSRNMILKTYRASGRYFMPQFFQIKTGDGVYVKKITLIIFGLLATLLTTT